MQSITIRKSHSTKKLTTTIVVLTQENKWSKNCKYFNQVAKKYLFSMLNDMGIGMAKIFDLKNGAVF